MLGLACHINPKCHRHIKAPVSPELAPNVTDQRGYGPDTSPRTTSQSSEITTSVGGWAAAGSMQI